MKKIFVLLVALTLVFSFALSAFAAEGEEVTTPTEENAVESEILPPTEDATADDTVAQPEEDDESVVKEYIGKLTDALSNSSLWTTLLTVSASLVAAFVFLRNKFGVLFDMLGGKADTSVITKKFDDKGEEILKAFKAYCDGISAKLEASEQNEREMWAIITIFMTHAKIAPAVKSEIIDRLTGIKAMSGTLAEIVAEADAAIKATLEAEKSLAPETPALDAIVEATESASEYITL